MQTAIPSSVSSKLANMGFWCACLVVVSHIFVMPDSDAMTFWARDVLTRVHAIDVPFFFLAAGYFLAGHVMEWRWWEGEVFKRARTLLLPFFLWILLWLVYEQALALGQGMLDGKPPSACVSIAIGALPASFGLNPLGSPALPPLWFVRTLFCLVVLSPLLVAPIKQGYLCGRLWMGMLLAVFGLYVVVFDSPYEALFGVSSFLTVSGIFWFTLGLFLRLHPVSVPLPAWGGAMLLAATLAVEVAVVLVTPPDSMWARLVSFVGGDCADAGRLGDDAVAGVATVADVGGVPHLSDALVCLVPARWVVELPVHVPRLSLLRGRRNPASACRHVRPAPLASQDGVRAIWRQVILRHGGAVNHCLS